MVTWTRVTAVKVEKSDQIFGVCTLKVETTEYPKNQGSTTRFLARATRKTELSSPEMGKTLCGGHLGVKDLSLRRLFNIQNGDAEEKAGCMRL